MLAAVLIGCSGAADERAFDGVDADSESSKSGRAVRASSDERGVDDVGELGAQAGSAADPIGDAGVMTVDPIDASAMAAPDAPEPSNDGEACMPGEVVCIAGSCTRCATTAGAGGTGGSAPPSAGSGGAGAGGAAGSAGSQPPPCDADIDADGVCDDSDVCPGASDADADGNGYADACDKVLWSDQVSIVRDAPVCTSGIALESWLEIHNSFNGHTENVRPDEPYRAGPFSESIAADASTDVKAAVSALKSFDDLSTKTHASFPSQTHYHAARASLHGTTITRFVVAGSFAESCLGDGSYKASGSVSWEVRGY